MEIRLAQFEMNNGAAFFFQFLGAREDSEGAFARQNRNA